MSFSVGIVGLPNAGKSTLFQALTKKEVDIASYPFTTISPNVGIVTVPDQRLEKIAQIINPQKIIPTIIEFVDIAGLVKGAHRGEGLGNQFLAQIRECDAILEIVRDFKQIDIEHVEKSIDPQRDIEIIKNELIMKDLETLEKTAQKEKKKDLSQTLNKIKLGLSNGKLISGLDLSPEEISETEPFQFLTLKPIIYLINGQNPFQSEEGKPALVLDLKLEKEISELSEKEKEELQLGSELDQLITISYNALNLITFYTIKGGKEVRAWTVEKEANILMGAEKVHTDFKEKFIKAEVINWEKLIQAQSWNGAREKGWISIVGREYSIQDGDVIEFKI